MEMNTDFLDKDMPEIHDLQFYGDGAKYFGIVALNLLFTILSLGLYYPWAKTAFRKYLWSEAEMDGSRFTFNGKATEIVKGFLLVYGIFILSQVLPQIFMNSGSFDKLFILYLILFVLLIAVLPLAVFGSYRYRISRTSWRGIYFGFDGKLKEFAGIFYLQLFLTIITVGIYSSWMRVKLMKYLFSHTKLGENRLDFHGDGGTLFGINLLGGVLMYPTLGMYIPIWMKNRFNFTIDHLTIQNETKRRALRSSLENREAWTTLMVNGLLLIVTLGLAFPWTIMRKMRMYLSNIIIPQEFKFDNLSQSETNYKDGTGDEIGDFLDIGFDF